MTIEFTTGDRVINPARADWGIGQIRDIERFPGQTAVRVRVAFAGVGIKTMVVPPARLIPPKPEQTDDERLKEKLGYERNDIDRLLTLPGFVSDRLAGLSERFAALLPHYRYDDSPKGVFDWAVRQLGVTDPLERFTADELARHFARFRRERDRVLRDLRAQAVATDLQGRLQELVENVADPTVRQRIVDVLADRNLC